MSNTSFSPDFKAEAIKQITERGHGGVDVAKRSRCQTRACTHGSSKRSKNSAQSVFCIKDRMSHFSPTVSQLPS